MINANKERVYAFIDSQNLNFGTSKDRIINGKLRYKGWKLDMKAFRQYLKDKFRVEKAFLFIGYIEENSEMYDSFSSFGYELIYKPTVKDQEGKPKGNVDAEIVLYSARIEYANFDKAVFVSGDGDFACLYDFLLNEGKLKNLVIPNKFSESSLLKKFQEYKVFLDREKRKLQYRDYKKTRAAKENNKIQSVKEVRPVNNEAAQNKPTANVIRFGKH